MLSIFLCAGWSQRLAGWAHVGNLDRSGCFQATSIVLKMLVPACVSISGISGCDSTSDCPSQSLHHLFKLMAWFSYLHQCSEACPDWNTRLCNKFEAHTKAMASFNAGPAACPKLHPRLALHSGHWPVWQYSECGGLCGLHDTRCRSIWVSQLMITCVGFACTFDLDTDWYL